MVCVLLGAGAGAAAGLLRQPEYKTDAQLYVGTFDVRTLAQAGVVTASQQLAAAYSRLATSEPIVAPVARQLGLSPQEVARRLSAANIVGTPVLRIQAIGPTRAEAVALVRAVSRETAAYVTRLTTRAAEAAALLQRFHAAVERARSLEARAAQLRAQRAQTRRVRVAEADAEAARLRANALAGLYAQARASSASAVDARIIDAGVTVTNDRVSVLQLLLFIGVSSGLVVGTGLAILRHRRLLRQE